MIAGSTGPFRRAAKNTPRQHNRIKSNTTKAMRKAIIVSDSPLPPVLSPPLDPCEVVGASVGVGEEVRSVGARVGAKVGAVGAVGVGAKVGAVGAVGDADVGESVGADGAVDVVGAIDTVGAEDAVGATDAVGAVGAVGTVVLAVGEAVDTLPVGDGTGDTVGELVGTAEGANVGGVVGG